MPRVRQMERGGARERYCYTRRTENVTFNERARAGAGCRQGTVIPQSGLIETLAGNGEVGHSGDGGDSTEARLNGPTACALDGAGNLFIADTLNHCVRVIDLVGWTIEAFVGTGEAGYSGDGGPAIDAMFNCPVGVAVGADGDVYICDSGNHAVRRVRATDGIVETVAGTGSPGSSGDGGPGIEAQLLEPVGVAVDEDDGLIISEASGHRVRRLDLASGTISTVAGTGEPGVAEDGARAVEAPLNAPAGVVVDGSGAMCIAEAGGNRVVMIDSDGLLHVVSGTGQPGASGDGGAAGLATYTSPQGVACDAHGNAYVADTENHAVRVIVAATGTVLRVAGGRRGFSGDGGDAAAASMARPHGCAVDGEGDVYIVDTDNHRLRVVGTHWAAGDDLHEGEDDLDDEY